MKTPIAVFWFAICLVVAGCVGAPPPSPVAADIRARLEAAVGKPVEIEGMAVRSGVGPELFLEIAKGVRIRFVDDANRDVKEGRLYFVSGFLRRDKKGPAAQYAISAVYISKRDKISSPLEMLPAIEVELPTQSMCGNDERFNPPVQPPEPSVPPTAAAPGAPQSAGTVDR